MLLIEVCVWSRPTVAQLKSRLQDDLQWKHTTLYTGCQPNLAFVCKQRRVKWCANKELLCWGELIHILCMAFAC